MLTAEGVLKKSFVLTKMKVKFYILILLTFLIIIPSAAFSGTSTFRIDMDADTPGLQSEIWVLPGAIFTTNVEVVLNSSNDTLSSFGYSLWWDTGELNTPTDENITTYFLKEGWEYMDPGSPYYMIDSNYIYNFAQYTFEYSDVSLTRIVASIDWTASNPLSDASFDIVPEFAYYPGSLDGAWDKEGNEITTVFEGGTVNVLPEPASLILFVAGSMTLVFKSYRKRRG
jgi:hypothetical protein